MLTCRHRSRASLGIICLAAALQVLALPSTGAACTCLDNATVLDLDTNTGGDDGQFSERLIVNAPDGQTWTVTAQTGAYDAFAVPPVGTRSPLVPIAVGQALQALGGNQYALDFVFVESIGYSLSVSNGMGTTLMTADDCRYPNPTFAPAIASSYPIADPPVTLGAIAVSGPPLASATFTIDGMPATQLVPMELAPVPAVHVAELTARGTGGEEYYEPCLQGVRKQFVIRASASAPAMNAAWGGALLIALLALGVIGLRRA